MQSEVQLAEANSKEKLLPLDQYLKDCWAKKQTAIDLTAYNITHEELEFQKASLMRGIRLKLMENGIL